MRMLAAIVVLVIATGNARGEAVTVLNPGFEQLVLSGPGGGNNYILFDIPNWNFTGQVATFKPGSSQFPGGVPEGSNVAAIGNNSGGGSIQQTLAATLESNTEYSLLVDVGRRLDFPFSTFNIELLAGNLTIASSSTSNPDAGTFQFEELSFTTGTTHAQLGQNLGIRLSGSTVGGQVDFDNVRLNAVAIPEPSTFAVWLLVVGFISTRRRRLRRRNRVAGTVARPGPHTT